MPLEEYGTSGTGYGVVDEFRRMAPEYWRISKIRQFFWQFFWRFPGKRAFITCLRSFPLTINDLRIGSKGRTRTYNHTVNSRVLYH